MPTPIHPKALKSHRDRKKWTQQKLADNCKGQHSVSVPTIKRIESYRDGIYPARSAVAESLAKALGVSVEDLSKEPSEAAANEECLRKLGYRTLRTSVDAETALAFRMVQHIYGIPIRSQIEMAPLFAALLAEGSLAWRRKRVEAIKDASEKLQQLGGGHCSFVNTVWQVDEGLEEECKSISKMDLFGVHASEQAFDCGYDPSENNPFADYLQWFEKETQAQTITFVKNGVWKTREGFPDYRIGEEIVDQISSDDYDARYAILHGHVRLKDIPDELLRDGKKDERIAWIISRIPSGELEANRAEIEKLLKDVRYGEAANDASTQDGQERDDDA